MPSLARSAFGTLLKVGNGVTPTEVFTTLAEVKSLGGISITRDRVDVTNHSSTGSWEEFIGTLLRTGEITAGILWVPAHATHNLTTGILGRLVNTDTRVNFQIAFPGGTVWSFSALVTGFSLGAMDVGSAMEATVTLKPSGPMTLA